MNDDEIILSYEQSNKIFHMPTDTITKASVKSKKHHNIQEPARTVDILSAIKHNSWMSASKCANANSTTILTPE